MKPHKKRRQFRKEHSVLIVKPHNIENQTNEWTNKFIMQAFERGIGEYWSAPTKSPELARNKGINKFLHDPNHMSKTHLFFIDDDSPPIETFAIEQLRSHNKPVIAGVTPIVRVHPKDLDCMWSAILEDKKTRTMSNIGIDDLPKKIFKARRVGGTCLLLQRKVLEKLKPPYQKTTFNDNYTDVKLSEDVYFADKIIEAGFDIWVDPDVQCHHYHIFDLLDIFAIVRQLKHIA
jgi:hypothetical protein